MFKRIKKFIYSLFIPKRTPTTSTANLNGLSPISQEIFQRFQMRCTKTQKADFITFMISRLGVHIDGLPTNTKYKNLVLGDVEHAKVVFTAHYDTPLRALFPIKSTPSCPVLAKLNFLLYALPSFFITLAVLTFAPLAIESLVVNAIIYVAGLAAMVASLFCLLGVKPNPNNANDNTSGVIMLCELIQSLSEAEMASVAFIFFDGEEKDCKGSKYFKRLHNKYDWGSKTIINFDCVADGDHFVVAAPKQLYEKLEPKMKGQSQCITLERSSTVKMSSDHKNFQNGIVVSALYKSKVFGYYLTRIHTLKDVRFNVENIHALVREIPLLLKHLT